jgi:hypothetical protein
MVVKSGNFTEGVGRHHIKEIGKIDKGIELFKYCIQKLRF